MKKKVSVSVGIACLNEANTIQKLLQSILLQNDDQFDLKEIILISDGSTDTTVEESRKIKDKRIIVHDEKERKGKATRINELCQLLTGDIFIFLDADISMTDTHVFVNLIQPFLKNPNIGLVGGNPHPKTGKTFIERAVNITFEAYAPLRTKINNGSNPHGCDGKILGLSKKFARTVHIPSNMIGTDTYLYFLCITKGFTFQHVPEAIVYYRSPATLQDQIKQNIRFISAEYIHHDVFGDLVDKEYYVAPRLFQSLLLRQFFKHPFSAAIIFLINRYCRYKAMKMYKTMDAKWQMITTTKG